MVSKTFPVCSRPERRIFNERIGRSLALPFERASPKGGFKAFVTLLKLAPSLHLGCCRFGHAHSARLSRVSRSRFSALGVFWCVFLPDLVSDCSSQDENSNFRHAHGWH
jgi:hypothetical protein